MKYVGADLHKKSISLCVVVVVNGKRQVVARARFECRDVAGLRKWFEELGPFQLAVEATATYECHGRAAANGLVRPTASGREDAGVGTPRAWHVVDYGRT